jgi:G3E family GTPase
VSGGTKNDQRIPVTVLTGFLGSGKTTLLNRILDEKSGKDLAIIVNEFGDIGIDGELIKSGEEELIELSNGCVCCVIRGDLIRTIRSLLKNKPNLDGIIIETTGLANPSPVIQTMVIDQVICGQCRLDSVVCVVDAVHILDQLETGPDAADQIAFCDHIVLNKVADTSESIKKIKNIVQQLNPLAKLTLTNHSNIPSKAVINCYGFDLDRIEKNLSPIIDEKITIHDQTNHIDRSGITSLSLTTNKPIDEEKLENWLQDLLFRYGNDILRTKGIFNIVGKDRKLLVQAVQMMIEGDFGDEWGHEERLTRLVFIGRNLKTDELREGFQSCQPKLAA